jgi:4,5-DOPA dioxygenase extradiol
MLPTLFISHGAPPLLDDDEWLDQLGAWADAIPTPRAIVIVSAHWETAPVAVSSPGVPLVYDFGGFDARFWTIDYQPPVDDDLVRRVRALTAAVPSGRGLDHGAWVPLVAMYPHAEVPVVQVSLPASGSADDFLDLGARLRALRGEGALVIGSGFATHGLAHLSRANWSGDPTPPGWSRDFDAWLGDLVARGDVAGLSDPSRAPGMPYAHPTAEHYTPLLVTLGAATTPQHAPPSTAIDGWFMGLSKRSLHAT